MANVEPDETPRAVVYTAIGVLLLCIPLGAMLIAGAESTLEGVAMVAMLTVMGLLYAALAVWSDARAYRDESQGND
jgi:hypothetical protein